MLRTLGIAALGAIALTACGEPTLPNSTEPAAVWSATGRCGVSRVCASGQVNAALTSCPDDAINYCAEGAACNPHDTRPCIVEAPDQHPTETCEGNAMNALTAYVVYACAPTGSMQRVN